MEDTPTPARSSGSICSRIARQRSNSACQSIGRACATGASASRIIAACICFMSSVTLLSQMRGAPVWRTCRERFLGARSQSFQPGISGGEAVTAALASANAACKAASFVWSREVFSTVPPSPLSLSRTLSAVTLRTSTKSAAVPG
jgi:hypothetical protein